jgi:DNA polymerase I
LESCTAKAVAELRDAGVAGGDLVALAMAPRVGLGLATARGNWSLSLVVEDPPAAVRVAEEALRPRWVVWSNDTAAELVRAGVRVATCWDLAAVHRLLFGGWRADPARVWAQLHGLAVGTIPTTAPADLFNQDEQENGDLEGPVRSDGHLRPEWVTGGWCATPHRLRQWAELASTVAALQQTRLAELGERPRAPATARAESAAELLCAEMSVDGLPMDRAVAEGIIAGFVGRRPGNATEAAEQRARRDAEVLRHAPTGVEVDLRSPRQVKSLLSRVGVEVPDTRASRLRTLRDSPPLVGALLEWRKAERIATTYGYAWLDEHLGTDGRLRGAWTACDGAAGRMTASGGLHNMPAEMRAAVIAEPGHVFVRADLGQIEPRVLAAISLDEGLARATAEDDMYAPMAAQLAVDRATAKVAVLAAMYGQTTGHGARALRRLETAYPVAMAYLDDAARAGQAGHELRTYGGRLIVMGPTSSSGAPERESRGAAAARGRYGRNALVQGAAAELFKMWAVTVRTRIEHLDSHIVLCLHDELLVHTPAEHSHAVARLLDDCLDEAVRRWAPDDSVRFIADIGTVERWSSSKAGAVLPNAVS